MERPSAGAAMAAALRVWPACVGASWGALGLLVLLEPLGADPGLKDDPTAAWGLLAASLALGSMAAVITILTAARRYGVGDRRASTPELAVMLTLYLASQLLLLIPDWTAQGAIEALWAAFVRNTAATAATPAWAVVATAVLGLAGFYVSARMSLLPLMAVIRRRFQPRRAWRQAPPILPWALLVNAGWLAWVMFPGLTGGFLDRGWGAAMHGLVSFGVVFPLAVTFLLHLYLQIDPPAAVETVFD